ncbi:hypothetical protein Bca4012_018485 [Brassica carinata]
MLLSKRTSALSQDAPPQPLGFRRTGKKTKGKTHHRIGSLIPQQGRLPEYLQLYIFDTSNEVRNRLNVMGQTSTEGNLDETTLKHLIEMIDENNCLANIFRRARDHYESVGKEFTIRLLQDKGKGKEYDLPSASEVAGLIVGDMSSTIGERDIVVQFQSDTLQQIRDDHPLFPFGEYGFHPEILLHLETGTSKTRKFVTLRQYYAAQIQTRLNQGMTLVKGGRLLHQYIVDIYTAIEEDRLSWARNNQDVLRAELYSNVLDAVSKGALMLKLLVKDLLITMMANPNWVEIKEHLTKYGGDSSNDRPDIECRVFKMKLDWTSLVCCECCKK